MSFGNINALYFLLLIPLVILLYFLKFQRRERIVPSTLFWDYSLKDRQVNTIFRRWQKEILLFLQIMALLSLIFGLARPLLNVKGLGRERTILVMDVSASMKSTDLKPSRWVAAQEKALSLVEDLKWGGEIMVLEASSPPRIRVPFTRDRQEIKRIIRRLEPKDIPTNLKETLKVAWAQLRSSPSSQIYVFTDGAYEEVKEPEINGEKVHWIFLGERAYNVGVTALNVRKTYYGSYDYQIFLALVNYSDQQLSFNLNLFLEGELINQQKIKLEPKVKRTVIIPFSSQGGGVLRAEIDLRDDLEVDNLAYAVIPPLKKFSVLLVSRGNAFLEKALKADPQVKLEVTTPDLFSESFSHDVVILDGFSPSHIEKGRYLLINSIPQNLPLQVLGKVEQPLILDWDRNHPVMRFVDLSKVVIEEALKVRPLMGSKTIVESSLTPLAFTWEEGDLKLIFLSFDLYRSDLPLRVAFPLLISNSLRWLYPSGIEDASLQVKSGQPLNLPVQGSLREAVITNPLGKSFTVKVENKGLDFLHTEVCGLYNIRTQGWEAKFGVNLVDDEESNILPRAKVRGQRSKEGEVSPTFKTKIEIWIYFILIGILILLIEWLLYSRLLTRPLLSFSKKDYLALGLRLFIITLLILSLIGLQLERAVDRMSVIFALDLSESISPLNIGQALKYLEEAIKRMRGEDLAGLVTFGSESSLEVSLQAKPSMPKLSPSKSGATNIEQAIKLALSSFPPLTAKRIVLISDGNENLGNALAATRMAKAEGVEIYPLPLSTSYSEEVILDGIILPSEVKYGESFLARIIARSTREGEGRLSLYRNGEFLGSQRVKLHQGKNVFAYQQSLEANGFHIYQVQMETLKDTLPQNNRTIGVTAVRGKPMVLYIEKDMNQAHYLLEALRSQNLEVELVGPTSIPESPSDLQRYDALILSNISALRMSKKQLEMIRSYVSESGGGLIMLGGEESFGVGGYYHTPVEDALPVTMESRQKVDVPSLAVVLVVDRSGSMSMGAGRVSKLDLAKEAAQLVVELLDERNEVGVLAFDSAFNWVVTPQEAKEKERINKEIASIKSGGGTDMFPALKEAYRALYGRKALLKHIIVLSDGQSSPADFVGLARRMARDKITLSSVAIGRDAAARLMLDISKWGKGRFYYTEDPYSIPRIFTLETQLASKSALIEKPFRPTPLESSHEILQGIDWQKVPPLGGYVATTAKATSEVLLASDQGDPILATWRYGLGRAVAFTSDAKAKWGILWLRWDDFSKFFGQLVRWTLRTTSRSDIVTTVSIKEGKGQILVEGADARGEFINFMESQVGVVHPDKSLSVVNLEQVAPGRYKGAFPIDKRGAYLIGVAQKKEGRMVDSQIASLVIPYSPEYKDIGANEYLLREMAKMTGGRVLDGKEDIFALSRKKTRQPVELWPWLVTVALLLLLPDIAIRRVSFANLFKERIWIKLANLLGIRRK